MVPLGQPLGDPVGDRGRDRSRAHPGSGFGRADDQLLAAVRVGYAQDCLSHPEDPPVIVDVAAA